MTSVGLGLRVRLTLVMGYSGMANGGLLPTVSPTRTPKARQGTSGLRVPGPASTSPSAQVAYPLSEGQAPAVSTCCEESRRGKQRVGVLR